MNWENVMFFVVDCSKLLIYYVEVFLVEDFE